MPITRVATGTAAVNTTGSTSISVTFSATAVLGDLILVAVSYDNSGGAINTPAGYTKEFDQVTASTHYTAVFSKVAAGGETGVTVTKAAGGTTMSAGAILYRGTNGLLYNKLAGNAGSNTVITSATQSPVPANSFIISFSSSQLNTNQSSCTVTGTGWSEVFDISSTTNNRRRDTVGAENSTGSGSVTGATFTYTQTSDLNYMTFWLQPKNIGYPLIMSM